MCYSSKDQARWFEINNWFLTMKTAYFPCFANFALSLVSLYFIQTFGTEKLREIMTMGGNCTQHTLIISLD